jgi:hypothetical protein
VGISKTIAEIRHAVFFGVGVFGILGASILFTWFGVSEMIPTVL